MGIRPLDPENHAALTHQNLHEIVVGARLTRSKHGEWRWRWTLLAGARLRDEFTAVKPDQPFGELVRRRQLRLPARRRPP